MERRQTICLRFLYFRQFSDFQEVLIIATKELQINEQIRDAEVRVIGVNGEQVGIMSSREAQHLADDAGLDLVKISPNAQPPVCRIMDYGKYRFEQASARRKPARISAWWKRRKFASV